MKRAFIIVGSIIGLVFLAIAIVAGFWYWREKEFVKAPYGQGTVTIEIAPGSSAPHLAKALAAGGVVSSAEQLVTHLHYFRRGAKTKAGEYEFALPLKPDQVIDKLVKGEVKLHHFTVPEGLRADEIAPIVGASGLCDGAKFLAMTRDPNEAAKYGIPGKTLEGYLFPDTYSVPKGIGCQGILSAMISRLRAGYQKAQAQRAAGVKLSEAETITLASIVEKETGTRGDRAHVSCVFHNRLKKHVPLATDPTVIYATLLANDFKWDGNIHKSDLQRPHPYNTYLNVGLPPGPISNPGVLAMEAALNPMICNDLYFVSRNDGSTVFCPDWKCHDAAVQKWQVEYFKNKK
jgi:UPF0755 protein